MKDLVLIGGGHSHVAVMRRFGMRPEPGVRLTVISRGVETPYSGMLPGVIAGHYTVEEAHIDLQRLARFARARLFVDEAIGLDLPRRRVLCRSRPPVPFDLLSIDIGSTPNASVPGALEHATPVKPIDRFLRRWDDMRARLLQDGRPHRVAVVGGGAGGVELLLSVQHCLRRDREDAGRAGAAIVFDLFTASETLLPAFNARVQRLFRDLFDARGVTLHAGTRIARVEPGVLWAEDGTRHEADEILWTTEAKAADWLRDSGLATDEGGFVQVSETLQSTSHPYVCAAGDVASMVGRRLEKSGVYAVREGQTLAPNLRRALRGEPLRPYRPQPRTLAIVSTGDRHAIAARGPFTVRGDWVWRWKDWIDRRFMAKYDELPAMPEASGVGADHAAHDPMRCGGCGAKVGADILSRALARVRRLRRDDVLIGLDAPDDAAVVEVPAGMAAVHTVDFFRALVDDPYVFGQLAATHALGDLHAMGARPHTALAIVTIPHGPDWQVEDTLTQLLSGAVEVLADAGAVLVGGHTSEGAELALGFTVNGVVDRACVLRKGGLAPGDRLVLTKAIGTGTLFAADMRHEAKGRWIEGALASMLRSNAGAAAVLARHGATACTDVTGFGLLGHLLEMARASEVDAEVLLRAVPVLAGAEETLRAGYASTMQPHNESFRRETAVTDAVAALPRFGLLFDPQTAGGLLAGVPAAAAEACVADLRAAGYAEAAAIGSARPRGARVERVTCLP